MVWHDEKDRITGLFSFHEATVTGHSRLNKLEHYTGLKLPL
jgi:hypothetical protein